MTQRWPRLVRGCWIALAVLLAACGGGGGDETPPPPVTPPAPTAPFANVYTSEAAGVTVDPNGQVFGRVSNFADGIVNVLEFSGRAVFSTSAGTWTLANALIYTETSTFYVEGDLPSIATTTGTVSGTYSPQGTLTLTIASPPRPGGLPETASAAANTDLPLPPALAALAGQYQRWVKVGPSNVNYADFTVGATGKLSGNFRGCVLQEGSSVSVPDPGSRVFSATIVIPACDIGLPAGTYPMAVTYSTSSAGADLSFLGADTQGRTWSFSGTKAASP